MAATVRGYTLASGDQTANEDWYGATDDAVVVLDGATIRTDTGCEHGLQWYVRHLGSTLLAGAHDISVELRTVLARAIEHVRGLHAETCNLAHPGTPSAAVGLVRRVGTRLDWLVLGDITVMVETGEKLHVEVDDRVSETALAERAECDRHLIGTDAKMAAILAMKEVELASRNVPGGYWIASTMPEAAEHALIGGVPLDEVRRFGVCSDGAMRCLRMTSVNTHAAALAVMATNGPRALVELVRTAEHRDHAGARWPRNKALDDATAVVVDLDPPSSEPTPASPEAVEDLTARLSDTRLLGASPTAFGTTI